MKENKFQKKVVEALIAKTAWILNVHGHRMQKSGVPDLQVVHRRWCGYLELKVGKNKCSPIQKQVIKKIKDRGFPVFVLRYIENPLVDSTLYKGQFYNFINIENEDGNTLNYCWYSDILNKLGELSETARSKIDVSTHNEPNQTISNAMYSKCENCGSVGSNVRYHCPIHNQIMAGYYCDKCSEEI